VHAEHGPANINRFDTGFSCHHRADSRAANRVILHHKVLHGYRRGLSLRRDGANDTRTHDISHVTLIGVSFQHNTLLDSGGMLWLVFFLIVRVVAMGHIRGDEETLSDRTIVIRLFHGCS
jgi:hypothetical protein